MPVLQTSLSKQITVSKRRRYSIYCTYVHMYVCLYIMDKKKNKQKKGEQQLRKRFMKNEGSARKGEES